MQDLAAGARIPAIADRSRWAATTEVPSKGALRQLEDGIVADEE